MNKQEQVLKEKYDSSLKAKAYNEKFNRLLHLIRGNFEFILSFLYDVIQSDRFKGSKLLEVGSGATVHHIASASAKYSSIVQSDYVLDNVEELQKWHEGRSSLDWSQFLDVVIQLESPDANKESARSKLESRIRNSVKCVVRGDLLSDDVLPLDQLRKLSAEPPYDLIISVLCIETVPPDFEGYIAVLRRIASLLRTGGGVIVCGYVKGSPWLVSGTYFHHLSLSRSQILEALEKAGFGNCDMKTKPRMESEYDYEYESVFCVAAEKL